MSSRYIPLSNLAPADDAAKEGVESELPSYETGGSSSTQGGEVQHLPTTCFVVTPKFYGGEQDDGSTTFRFSYAVDKGFGGFHSFVKQRLESTPNLPFGFSDDFVFAYKYNNRVMIVKTTEELGSVGKVEATEKYLYCIRPENSLLFLKEMKWKKIMDELVSCTGVLLGTFGLGLFVAALIWSIVHIVDSRMNSKY